MKLLSIAILIYVLRISSYKSYESYLLSNKVQNQMNMSEEQNEERVVIILIMHLILNI